MSIVENLVAISILGIVIISVTPILVTSMQSNGIARSHTSLVADVQSIVDGYRNSTYQTILDKFATTYTAITDGQTVSESSTSSESRASYSTTFTAIKLNPTSSPEAVKITVVATQRRGNFPDASYTFETVISEAR